MTNTTVSAEADRKGWKDVLATPELRSGLGAAAKGAGDEEGCGAGPGPGVSGIIQNSVHPLLRVALSAPFWFGQLFWVFSLLAPLSAPTPATYPPESRVTSAAACGSWHSMIWCEIYRIWRVESQTISNIIKSWWGYFLHSEFYYIFIQYYTRKV